MALTLGVGKRLFSTACSTELMVIKAPAESVDITIGGSEPVLSAAERGEPTALLPGHDGGTLIGKRYVDDSESIELLCTKAGDGLPALGESVLHIKDAKPLPTSD